MGGTMPYAAKDELLGRIGRLHAALCARAPGGWDAAFVMDKVNMLYLASTMQDGAFVLTRDGSHALFVRSSLERAKGESPLGGIRPMRTYKDVADVIGGSAKAAFVETESVTYEAVGRLRKYVDIEQVLPLGRVMAGVRAVKSPYELGCMEEAGRLQHGFLTGDLPYMLVEGMSEARLMGAMYARLLELGHQGLIRFSAFQSEMPMGQFGFGAGSAYPSSFDGPGGMAGRGPEAQNVGSPDRRLRRGELVFVDVGFGVRGYQTDKTQVYMFGGKVPPELAEVQGGCVGLQAMTAKGLTPGARPSDVYASVMRQVGALAGGEGGGQVGGVTSEFARAAFRDGFMGVKGRGVRFLGHGVGLHIDELPVIAEGFDDPLVPGMTVAIEPKIGLPGVGTVGVEDTYVVGDALGARCITGGGEAIIEI